MALQQRLIAYLVAVHLFFLVIVFTFYDENPLAIVLLEVTLVLSMVLGIYLVKQVLRPFEFARQFHELLHDQNYAVRMRANANSELNDLVNLFNKLLESLYQERLTLGEQRGLLEKLLAATPTAVMVFDFDGKLNLLNTSAYRLLGASSLDTTTFSAPVAPGLMASFAELAVGQSRVFADTEGRRYRCQRGQFIDRSFTRDFILVDEITVELANSEKATYEKLVRVLAHEVNNTVAATGSVLESLLFYQQQLALGDRTDFFTAITAVRQRNTNLGDFIERFTRVVKLPMPERRPVHLRGMLEGLMQLYATQCSEKRIVLAWRQCDAVDAQLVDVQLLEQALVNILKNAIEAAEAAQVANGEIGAAYVHIALTLEDTNSSNSSTAKCVRLSVMDSGNGLASLPQGQLFTPFFTTKKGGQGIGLIFVREVLNRHGFAHRLASNANAETQFDIWFT